MTAKFRHITDQLKALVTFRNVKAMSDDDFIANIDAVNVLCSLYDDLGIDHRDIRHRMSGLYHELMRRINSKKEIQPAMPLIKALYRFIFDRNDDFGPAKWRASLNEMCRRVVEEYRESPLIDTNDYLFALDVVCCMEENDKCGNSNGAEPFSKNASSLLQEYQEAVTALLEGIDNAPLSERIRRVRAYERAKLTFTADNWEEWATARESLIGEYLSGLDDSTLILWWEITDEPPMRELKKRAGNSNQMTVEYLQAQVFNEFARQSKLKAKRKLTRDLKTLNDDIIGDIIPVRINADMSVATLCALETIFYLRLQLAQVGWDDNEPIYESLCRNRFEKIANALVKKYPKAETLNEKIEILERLSIIGGMIHSHHSDFAIEEADKLMRHPCRSSESGTNSLPNTCAERPDSCCGIPAAASSTAISNPQASLSYSQRLRLEWIPNINSENESQIVADLLPKAETAFDMETLALISDYVTPKEREAIFNRFTELLEAAIQQLTTSTTPTTSTTTLASLLTLAAYWNSCPTYREMLKDFTKKVKKITNLDSELSEARIISRLNPMAAEIYSRIDKITGKYDILSA